MGTASPLTACRMACPTVPCTIFSKPAKGITGWRPGRVSPASGQTAALAPLSIHPLLPGFQQATRPSPSCIRTAEAPSGRLPANGLFRPAPIKAQTGCSKTCMFPSWSTHGWLQCQCPAGRPQRCTLGRRFRRSLPVLAGRKNRTFNDGRRIAPKLCAKPFARQPEPDLGGHSRRTMPTVAFEGGGPARVEQVYGEAPRFGPHRDHLTRHGA